MKSPTALILAACAVALVAIAIPGSQTDRFPGDLAILEAVQAAGWFGPVARFFRVPIDDWIIPFLGVCLVVYLAWRREQPAAVAVVAIWVAPIFTHILKAVIDRPRPSGDFVVHYVPDTAALPSGHATNGAVFATLVALVALRLLPRAYAIPVVVGCIVFAALAGISRTWLGVHWPSDVVMGWIFGFAFTLAAWTLSHAVATYWAARSER